MSERTTSVTAQVPTTSGSRYLQQLCKHWSHNLQVDFTPEQGTVIFPREGRGGVMPCEALVTMIAHPATLEVRIEGGNGDHVDGLKPVVERHLDRFAFREAPLAFPWEPHRSIG